MALKEMSTGPTTRIESERFEFENKGDVLEGYLLETAVLTSKESGKSFKKYTIRTKSGNRSTLGSHQLDQGLAQVPNGSRVRITYEGTKKLGGGKSVKLFRVEADVDDTLPGHGNVAASASSIIANSRISA